MTEDLQTLLRPLRELEPTSEELDRARAAAREPVLGAPVERRRPLRRIALRRPRLALVGAATIAIALAVTFAPVGDEHSLRSALRAAAAAAAAAEPPVPALTGYRHVVERVDVQSPGSAPREYRPRGLDRRAVAWRRAERLWRRRVRQGRRRSRTRRDRSGRRRSRSCPSIPTRCSTTSTPRMTTADMPRPTRPPGQSSPRGCGSRRAAGSRWPSGPPG